MTNAPAEVRAGLRRRAADLFDFHLNPVLVKDIRCWLRSKVFLSIFFITLVLAQFATVSCILMAERQSNIGRGLFTMILCGLAFCLGGILPYLVQSRFSEELRNRSTELVLISRLRPVSLIHGKVLSTFAAGLLYFSAVGPTLLIAYLLGGITLGLAFYCIVLVMLLSFAVSVLSLLFVSMRKEKPLRLMGLVCLGGGMGASGLVGAIIEDATRLSGFFGEGFWIVNLIICLIAAAIIYFFYTVAAAQLSFKADNRDKRPRRALTCLMLLAYLAILFGPYLLGDLFGTSSIPDFDELIFPAFLCAFIAFCVGLFFILDTPDQLSARVRAAWPRHSFVRFLYCPGLGRLYAYILFHFGLLLLMAAPMTLLDTGSRHMPGFAVSAALLAAAFLFFALPLTVFEWIRAAMPSRAHRWSRAIGVLILIIVWGLLGAFAAVLTSALDGPEECLLLSPPTALAYLFDRWSRQEARSYTAIGAYALPLFFCFICWMKAIRRSLAENRLLAREARSLAAATTAAAEVENALPALVPALAAASSSPAPPTSHETAERQGP